MQMIGFTIDLLNLLGPILLLDAFVLNTGCMANFKHKQVWVREGFYYSCGSSAVFYFSNSDFPRTSMRVDVMKTKF